MRRAAQACVRATSGDTFGVAARFDRNSPLVQPFRLSGEKLTMADDTLLIDTLRRTYDRLREIRKDVAAGNHFEALFEIDSLVGLAEQITLRKIKLIDPTPDLTAR